ncbi:MAG TPA: hypothetical protein V6D50_00745 [Chroococcales cyanobacterium]
MPSVAAPWRNSAKLATYKNLHFPPTEKIFLYGRRMSNPIKIGSPGHNELFCQSLLASHREYEPERLAWPELDTETLDSKGLKTHV